MKGIICYYSGSGNTRLAANYIKEHIRNADLELYDIVRTAMPDLSEIDIVGFATFTDFWGVPPYIHTFFEEMNPYPGKPAFVFNTFGAVSGKTLKHLANLARHKEFNVLAGHSLHTPENYPPMRRRGMAADDAPNPKEFDAFNAFITKLDRIFENIKEEKPPTHEPINLGFWNGILPAFPRTKSKKDFGEQNVDEEKCIQCDTCEQICPYEAVKLSPFPVFDHTICKGCWACYNHCPEQAIFTNKFKGEHQYPKPNEMLVNKLTI